MKSEKNILVAFLLNLCFSVFEFIGGSVVGSIAIIADSIHDLGDAITIGLSYVLEKKSKKAPDDQYPFGYARFSDLGSLITTLVLILGSSFLLVQSIKRLFKPTPVNYNGMIVFAIIGVIVNFTAAYFTHGGHSSNQRAVNLHMLEDVFGWLSVLVCAVIMKFTNFYLLDPIISIIVSLFIIIAAVKNLKEFAGLFLLKTPDGVPADIILNEILNIPGVNEIFSLRVINIDSEHRFASVAIGTDNTDESIKSNVRTILDNYGIQDSNIETIHTR
ncbi:MAG: cation transporter [Clostridia bacterium]|nr:cation transporter [Clostridia bacterium]